ncbi:MAG: choice-of-anchor N protein [Anaerolineae bacterium]|nr:choice-of-anchor N protein [Anaerolineae bacterium]
MKPCLAVCGVLVILLAAAVGPAEAVPDLQLYIEGAEWDDATETWVTTTSDFNLWVIGANQAIGGVKVAAALESDADPTSGTVTLESAIESVSYSGSGGSGDGGGGFANGTPTMGNGSPLPPHDIYPTWFGTVNVGDFLTPYTETVYDMQPGETGSAPGEIQYVHVTIEGFERVHFDAYNHTIIGKYKARFAPFSHDAGIVPEPGTLLLLCPGIAGLLVVRRRGRRAGRR